MRSQKVLTLIFVCVCMKKHTAGQNENSSHQFTEQPLSVVQAQGLNVEFKCLFPTAETHHWEINGDIEDLPSDVVITPPANGSLSILQIPATPMHNNTIVRCLALFPEGSTFDIQYSRSATLRVQGPLLINSSYVRFEPMRAAPTSITVTWDPPFSLNLTTAEPDIQYCVDVYTKQNELMQSTCGILATEFIFSPINPNHDDFFIFRVTPRSNINGSLNGTTSRQVIGYFCKDRTSLIKQPFFSTNVYLNPATISYQLLQEDSDKVCGANYSYLELKPLDEQDSSKNHTRDCTLSRFFSNDPNTIALTFDNSSCDFERHKLYNMKLHESLFYGGNIESDWIEISTHDVQNPHAYNTSKAPGNLTLKNTYLLKTTDLGSFFVLRPENSPTETVYRSGPIVEGETIIFVGNLSHSIYQVYVFDIEPNGNPRALPATLPQLIELVPVPSETHHFIDSKLSVNSPEGMICINCPFSTGEVSGCVAVIHSIQFQEPNLIALSISSGKENCISMKEGNYSVAVFGQNQNYTLKKEPDLVQTVSVSSPTETPGDVSITAVVAVVVGCIVFTFIFVAVISCWAFHARVRPLIRIPSYWSRRRRASIHPTEGKQREESSNSTTDNGSGSTSRTSYTQHGQSANDMHWSSSFNNYC